LTDPELHLVVPGPLDQRTGGYIYDRRIVEGLRAVGRPVRVHPLPGCFPGPEAEAEQALEATVSDLPDGSLVVIDGLALGGLPGPAVRHADRLALLGLVHHPVSEETGLSVQRANELEALERIALQSCRGIIVTSQFTADRLREWLQPCPLLRVVTPGIDGVAAERPEKSTAVPRLLCVGSLVPRKGQDLLVQALAQLRDRSWHCLLAGSEARDIPFATQLRSGIGRLGLGARVEILGECTESVVEELYATADVFVLPAWYEGYGMAFTEAMSHGLPVIATTGGAIPFTVPATAGLLVTPGDVDALTKALARLLDDSRLRAVLARGAWDYARSLPTWEQVCARFAGAATELAAS
jgi:glycosyltransferase involved in cell wall biosynthesis